MIEREVIRFEITSGEAGCTCTRFASRGRFGVAGGGSDILLPSYLVLVGITGGVEGAILEGFRNGWNALVFLILQQV
jgi:hypothetical protein